ncbi:copper transporter [Aquihabitans sp. G128]|uniref:copper transporter n=1 Tax=Aquihabitans sp. G128 TaxID=2849779 RepID=UPI001C22FE4D|nr:copper transporter [Aquihabitans sp. G128]QXC62027.1 copper transporter [Aquihabitans sp. G128]
MINLRYHVVSLTAVFLALAIGVAMGTGFLNKATVDQLRTQISKAEGGIKATNEKNAELQDEVDRGDSAEQALFASASRVVGDRLTDVPVLVIANENIDGDSLDRLRQLLVAAGADLRGTLTITDRLRLDAGDDDQLAELLGTTGQSRPVLQSALTTAVATDLRKAADRAVTSEAGSPELVQKLLEAKYLGYEAADGGGDASTVLAGGGYRYVFVSGPDPRTPDLDFLVPVLSAMAKAGPTRSVLVSAAVGDQAEETRTAAVGAVRNATDLRDEISTVDDLETVNGLLATVYAVADADAGTYGHYGLGSGSEAPLPGAS